MRRAAVIGLDGATWTVLRPLLEDGTMPNLATLLDRSATGILRSTIPPYTPPAWTSAVTGVNPGRHGVFGFVQGRTEPRLSHWGLVRSPALWQYLEADGRTTGLFHLPLTYPPPPVSGWAVGAVWMPTGREITGFAHPPEVEDRLRSLIRGYAPASGVEVFEDWRDTTLADRIAATVRERFIALADLLEHRPVDVVWAVLEAPDRLHHAYFKYFDPAEPLSRRPAAVEVRRSSTAAFREVDRVVGLLDAYAGEDGVALVCSDHGATGWDGYVFGNQLLAREGLLALQAGARAMRFVEDSGLGALARRIVPARLSYRIRRRVQRLFDPGRTEAYANRLGTQGFSVNLAGREPNGSVESGRAATVLHRLEDTLRAARTPSGEPLFPSIRRREDVYRGPAAHEAPDLVVEPAGWRWEVSDAMASNELFRRMTDLPLGCHHPDGVLALRAPGVLASEGARANIVDVLPTLLYAAGLAVPDGLDGEARRDLFGPASPAVLTSSFHPEVAAATEDSPYTRQEEALITKYLTDLGYIG